MLDKDGKTAQPENLSKAMTKPTDNTSEQEEKRIEE
jgi:hypothetical protein